MASSQLLLLLIILFIKLKMEVWYTKYIDQLIEVNAHTKNKKYYESLGYVMQDNKFFIKCTDLLPNSRLLETRKCDICKKDFTRRHEHHVVTEKRFAMDLCPEYVTTNSDLRKKIQDKKEKSWEIKYGGHPMKTNEVKQKVFASYKEKYGSHPMQNSNIKKKWEDTLIEKYGGASPLCSSEVRAKAKDTMLKNGDIPTSLQQEAIYNIIKQLYPNNKVMLNEQVSDLCLDVGLFLDDVKIDVEYDGSYWHKNKQNKDRRRDEFLKTQGFKILRIKSGHEIPSKEKIVEAIDVLKNTTHTYTEIILGDW